MLVIRSDKYRVPVACNHLVHVVSNDGKVCYVDKAKYVDVDSNMVFILDGAHGTIVPSYATVSRCGEIAAMSRLFEIFGPYHPNYEKCVATN